MSKNAFIFVKNAAKLQRGCAKRLHRLNISNLFFKQGKLNFNRFIIL